MDFSKLKVIELASVLAGPSVGMFFSEMGANVIKIENKKTNGDVTRNWKLPSEKKEEQSAYFSSINWKKKHLFLDYSLTDDYRKVIDLIIDADIVICNFKYGTSEKFKLDYETLRGLNPNLIYAQLNGFTSKPERVAFDVVLQAECGYMFMNGQEQSPPTKMPLALIDILAAHQLKEGVLVALLRRTSTGKGSLVVSSLEQTAISSLANQATNWLMNKHIPQRIGSLHPNIAPYGEIFITKDNKEIVLAIGSDQQFQKFCTLILADNILVSKKYESNKTRVENRQDLKNDLQNYIIRFDCKPLIDHCIESNIPVGAIKNMEEVFQSSTAQDMILEETINDQVTKRVSTIAFEVKRT